MSVAMNKKQGVSGQSLAVSRDVNIVKHNKDFRSRTIIKEAIMENDFLKNLSQGQVRLPFTSKLFPIIFTQKYFTIVHGKHFIAKTGRSSSTWHDVISRQKLSVIINIEYGDCPVTSTALLIQTLFVEYIISTEK